MAEPTEASRRGFIAWCIEACARHPGVTLLLVAASAAIGVWSIRQVPLDAIPDLSDAQVIVYTEWPGRGADLVEDQVTYPISSKLLAAPGVQMTEHVTAEAAAASPLYKATHGHDPRAPALGAALIFTGPGAPEGHTLGRVSMLDVAPTVARMLGVTLPDAEGRPLLS